MVMLCFIVRIRSEGVFIDWSVDICRIIVINVYWSIYLMDLIVNNNRLNIINKRNFRSFVVDDYVIELMIVSKIKWLF